MTVYLYGNFYSSVCWHLLCMHRTHTEIPCVLGALWYRRHFAFPFKNSHLWPLLEDWQKCSFFTLRLTWITEGKALKAGVLAISSLILPVDFSVCCRWSLMLTITVSDTFMRFYSCLCYPCLCLSPRTFDFIKNFPGLCWETFVWNVLETGLILISHFRHSFRLLSFLLLIILSSSEFWYQATPYFLCIVTVNYILF
jgi:hypothetical protein